ncbi:MAG: GGDEF domain-containing protein [Spirochaetes bacterium]|nr:GGDEF domain-containing protein [Spirochaetota bacterium]
MSKKSIILAAVFLYLTAAILTTCINLRNNREQALKYLDINLGSAVMQAESMIDRNIHLSFPEEINTDLESETEISNMEELSQFCYQADLEKITFIYKTENNFIVMASSANDEDMKTGNYTKAFSVYNNNRDRNLLNDAYHNNKHVFSSITDASGSFRNCAKSVLLPDDRTLLILVTASTAEIMSAANSSFIKSILLSLFFLAFIIPLIVLLIAYEKKEKTCMNQEIYYDCLTGLPNEKSLRKTFRQTKNITLIICNIENLKKYNYYYGYATGNTIIKLVSAKLQNWIESASKTFKIKPVLFKLQMDEFAVVISKHMDNEQRTLICRKLSEEFSYICCNLNNQSIPVSVIFSAAYMTPSGSVKEKTIDDLFILGDMAIQNTKNTSNQLTIFGMEDMNSMNHGENFHISQLVKDSIDNDSIVPYFQPIINNLSGKIEKYEALIRIIDKTGELILPKKFLENSKQSKIYPSLSKIMIEKTFSWFHRRNFDFSINISIEDICNPETSGFIYSILAANPETSAHCIFEIIDIGNVSDFSEIINFSNKLKNYGAKIAVDDFGSDFSNFKSISRVDVDFIKIDPSIIKNLQSDSKSKIIAETIIDYSKKMKIKTIAQFVYNKAVFNEVKAMGIDYSQGYYLGIPSGKVDF